MGKITEILDWLGYVIWLSVAIVTLFIDASAAIFIILVLMSNRLYDINKSMKK